MTALDSNGLPILCARPSCAYFVQRVNGKPNKYCREEACRKIRRHERYRKANPVKEIAVIPHLTHEDLNRRYREARGI